MTNVTKRFGQLEVLREINLSIHRGEILTLLGPSGCGKSTLMRMIAGFETMTSGGITLDGVDMLGVSPERRPVNMVFQRYALFPHLDVFDNVAFGLRLKKLPKDVVRKKTLAMLELVQLTEYKDRWIHQISGGQAQRVALARALVNEPRLLLLDEPLAALDLKIRQHMLRELKRIHTETGITFLYVTHDQDEAMILSDRIVLMNKGKIEQVGTPEEMYGRPNTLFGAKFLGETNIIRCEILAESDEECAFSSEIGRISVEKVHGDASACRVLSMRPEALKIQPAAESTTGSVNSFDGTVNDVIFVGSRIIYGVRVADKLTLYCQEHRGLPGAHFNVGDQVNLTCPPAAIVALPDN